MFSKILILTGLGTTLVGGGAISGITPEPPLPRALEIAAGPVRVETGGKQILSAHMANHSELTLTIKFKSNARLEMKF